MSTQALTQRATSVTASSISATSSTSRKPRLEAIQTQRAQASVTFRPVSSTSSTSIPHPDQESTAYHVVGGDNSVYATGAYTEPGLALASASTATPGQDTFPFTPSTLVGSASSPVNMENAMRMAMKQPQHQQHQQQDQERGVFQTVPLSPTRGEKSTPASPVSAKLHHHANSASPRTRKPKSVGSPTTATQHTLQHHISQRLPPVSASSSFAVAPAVTLSRSKQYQLQHQQLQQQLQLQLQQQQQLQHQQASQGMDLTYSSTSDDPRFQHLPNLWQVLHRKTLPPVCLFNFYLYMRDFEKSAEEVDFWLDVTAHEVLWRLYVRATKRRAAVQAMMDKEAAAGREQGGEDEAAEVEEDSGKTGVEAEKASQEQGKGHQQKPSLTLALLKPHWSVANQYLELSETDKDQTKNIATTSNDGYDQHYNTINSYSTHDNNTLQHSHPSKEHHFKDASDPLLLSMASPKSPLSPASTLGLASGGATHHAMAPVPGAVPANWSTLPSEANNANLKGLAGPPQSLPGDRQVKDSMEALSSPVSSNHDPQLEGIPPTDSITPETIVSRSGAGSTDAATTSATESKAAKRMSTTGGVTKEDLMRSAERIYFKYMIPQAEKRVRIPGTVRHRVALLMDSKMVQHPEVAANLTTGFEAAHAKSQGTLATKVGAGVGGRPSGELDEKTGVEDQTGSTHSLRRKNNLGITTTTMTTNSSTPSSASVQNEKHDKGSSASSTGGGTGGRSRLKAAAVGGGTSSSLSIFPQPDQDLGLVFSEAREIVFEGMESYYFPRFLKARAYGNMVHSQRLFRLVLGLFLLFLGFVIVLCLIFLNVRPRSVRAWALIPMFVGIMLCTTFQFNICPMMVLMQVSETKWMQFAKIKEPYILMLHRQRAIKVVVVAVLYTLCVGIIFGLLPGYRL